MPLVEIILDETYIKLWPCCGSHGKPIFKRYSIYKKQEFFGSLSIYKMHPVSPPATKLKRRKKLGFWKFSKNITLPRPWFLSTPRKANWPHREPIKLPIQGLKGEQGRTVAIPNGLPSLNFCNFMPEIWRIIFFCCFMLFECQGTDYWWCLKVVCIYNW